MGTVVKSETGIFLENASWGMSEIIGGSFFSLLSPFCPFLLPFPSSLSPPLLSLPPPLEVGPLNPAIGFGGAL